MVCSSGCLSTVYNLIPVVREFDEIIAGLIKTDKNKDDFVAFLVLSASF